MADLVPIEAQWELSSAGFVQPNHDRLVAVAFWVAALVEPGFAPPHHRRQIARTSEAGEYGGYLSTDTYRLGNDTQGVEVGDTISDPSDGIAPYTASTVITGYGLPEGCTLTVDGTFYAPMLERPNPARLHAQVPAATVAAIRHRLRAEFGATFTPAEAPPAPPQQPG